jgi:hypothetical protein
MNRLPRFSWPIRGRIKAAIALLGAALATILVATAAVANSPPPVPTIWFKFKYEVSWISLQGLQYVQCEAIACQNPVVLHQYGKCSDPICIPPTAEVLDFDCADKTCLIIANFYPDNLPYKSNQFKLIGQFSDRARTSNVVPVESDLLSNNLWQVTVSPTDLNVTKDSGSLDFRTKLFFISLILTIPVELVAAALWLYFQKSSERVMGRTLATIAIAHLVTFPTVWGFFPALESFQYLIERALGTSCLAIAIVYALVLGYFRSRSAASLTVGSILLLPIAYAIGLFISLWIGYGENTPLVGGLPNFVTLPASEIFAVLYEAGLIVLLSRGVWSFRQAGILSLLTNTASLVLGLLCIPLLQVMRLLVP